jgi:Arc/MetJ-type ribon-helix-helix transcriptional regulator
VRGEVKKMTTKTEVINVKVPATLFNEIEKLTQGRYLSKGEFTRAAIVRFLSSLGFFKPFSVRIREIRKEVQTKVKGKFTPEEEINELRRVRKNLWKRKG